MKWYIITGCYGGDNDIAEIVSALSEDHAIDLVRYDILDCTDTDPDDITIEQVFECDTLPRHIYAIP